MKLKFISLLVFSVFSLNGLLAQETFKMMFYNLLDFPSQDEHPNRIQYLQTILSETQPDIFMVCELNSEEASVDILREMQSINGNYAKADFFYNTSDDAIGNYNDLQNLLYYDRSKFNIESQTIIPTLYRDFNHYQLLLNSVQQQTDPVYLEVIVGHLKASNGQENEALRYQMVQDLEIYLEELPANSNIVFAGDFNFYMSSEDGFLELLNNTNKIVFADPANRSGSWHNNLNYIDMFTQSTRTQSGLGGASGGFDDRFDFILTSQNLISGTDLVYVPESYKVIGNNGNPNCFNNDINSEHCSGSDYSSTIREALYNFSDHLPVTLELQANQALRIDDFKNTPTIEFIGSNIIVNTLKLKQNTNLISNQTLYVYDSFGKLIKTINTKNSIYIHEDMSLLANGLYYIVLPQMNMKPLKFVIVH